MFKEWIWPVLWGTFKFLFAVGVLTGVWFSSALYHRKFYSEHADAEIRIRVRAECVRPDYVKTELDAQKFDLTLAELDLVRDKLGYANRRMEKLMDEVERIDTLRLEATRGKVRPAGGMGGPAPGSR